MVDARRQKLVIGVAAALMMLLGASLAWASGLTASAGGSLPTIVASDRLVANPVPAAPSAGVSESMPSKPSGESERATVTDAPEATGDSPVPRKETSSPAAGGDDDDEDDRETVKPPVRDEDEDDDDDVDDDDEDGDDDDENDEDDHSGQRD